MGLKLEDSVRRDLVEAKAHRAADSLVQEEGSIMVFNNQANFILSLRGDRQTRPRR